MKLETHVTINLIEETRRLNNSLWMNILRVAIKHAPSETKTILRQINHNDRYIADMLLKLAED